MGTRVRIPLGPKMTMNLEETKTENFGMQLSAKSFMELSSRVIATGLLASYALGFVTWNYFLNSYSFFEYNLLQTRYISAGLLFLFLFGFFVLVLTGHGKVKRTWPCIITLFVVVYAVFIFGAFPRIPSYMGGAKPFVTAIVATPENLKYLGNLDIKLAYNAGKAEVETMPLCNLYQNSDFIIVGVVDEQSDKAKLRVLVIKNSLILGLNQRQRYGEGEKRICDNFKNWQFKTTPQ